MSSFCYMCFIVGIACLPMATGVLASVVQKIDKDLAKVATLIFIISILLFISCLYMIWTGQMVVMKPSFCG